MLTENDVVMAVGSYLEARGYSSDQALTTDQQGIDLVATRPDGYRCFVEAKGGTSSKKGTNRYGKEFSNNQIKSQVGLALLKALQLSEQFSNSEVFIAFPNNEGHFRIVDS